MDSPIDCVSVGNSPICVLADELPSRSGAPTPNDKTQSRNHSPRQALSPCTNMQPMGRQHPSKIVNRRRSTGSVDFFSSNTRVPASRHAFSPQKRLRGSTGKGSPVIPQRVGDVSTKLLRSALENWTQAKQSPVITQQPQEEQTGLDALLDSPGVGDRSALFDTSACSDHGSDFVSSEDLARYKTTPNFGFVTTTESVENFNEKQRLSVHAWERVIHGSQSLVTSQDRRVVSADDIAKLDASDQAVLTTVQTHGLPCDIRGDVWFERSGAAAKRASVRDDYYECLVRQMKEGPV